MRLIARTWLILTTILCAVLMNDAQEKLRTVDQPRLYQYRNTPVTVDVKFNDREMVERKAMAGSDWLHRLSLDVTNTSGKSIKDFRIDVILRDAQTTPGLPSVAISMWLSRSQPNTKMLQPGDRITLRLPGSNVDRLLESLTKQGTSEVDKVILDVRDFEFMDGTRWLMGDLLRLDPESGRYKKVDEGSSPTDPFQLIN